MARNQRRVQQQRQKRKAKQRSIRRSQSGSPYRQIGRTGEVVACYVTQGWRERGQAAIFCLVATPGGGHATATFLVDLWCVGLKDAWGKLNISAKGFKENILDRASNETEVELVRVDVDWVRKIVAGAIRFAEQNGVRVSTRVVGVSLDDPLAAVVDSDVVDSRDQADAGHEITFEDQRRDGERL